MTIESRIEQATCRKLQKVGCLTPKMREPGWPDRQVLVPGGATFFIEFKQPGGALRPDQEVVIEKLRARGYAVLVLDFVPVVEVNSAGNTLWLSQRFTPESNARGILGLRWAGHNLSLELCRAL